MTEGKSVSLSDRDRASLKTVITNLSKAPRVNMEPPLSLREFEELFWDPGIWNGALKTMLDTAPKAVVKKRYARFRIKNCKVHVTCSGWTHMTIPDDDVKPTQVEHPNYAVLVDYVDKLHKMQRKEYFVEEMSKWIVDHCSSTGQLLKTWPELIELDIKDHFIADKLDGLYAPRARYPIGFTAKHRRATMAMSPILSMGLLVSDTEREKPDEELDISLTDGFKDVDLSWTNDKTSK